MTVKKLIEVALPLEKINAASAREKSIRHGHPSTLHLWWARRPLAAARAVLFAQMVNDPGYQQGGGFRYGVNKEKAALERHKAAFGTAAVPSPNMGGFFRIRARTFMIRIYIHGI